MKKFFEKQEKAKPERPGAVRAAGWGTLFVLCLAVTVWVIGSIGLLERESRGTTGFAANNYSNAILADQRFSAELTAAGNAARTLCLILVAPEEGVRFPLCATVTTGKNGGTVQLLQQQIPIDQCLDGQEVRITLPEPLRKGEVCRITLETEETDAAYAFRVLMGDAAGTDVQAWYCEEEPQPQVPMVTLVFPNHRGQVLAVAMLVLAWLMALLAVWRPGGRLGYWRKKCAPLCRAAYALLWPLLLFWCTELLNSGNIAAQGQWTILGNLLILCGLELVLAALCGRLVAASFWAGSIVLAAGMVNYYLQSFRGTVLLPSDLFGVTTAAQVISGYEFRPEAPILYAVLVWMCGLTAALCFRAGRPEPEAPAAPRAGPARRQTGKKVLLRLAAGCMGLTFCAVPVLCCERFDASRDLFAQTMQAREENGFLLNFALNVPLLFPQKPQEYDPQQIPTLVEGLDEAETVQQNVEQTAQRRPNILVIMNESFTDPTTLFPTGEEEPLLPVLEALKEDPAAKVGQTGVSIFGGGTSCSEYEWLTGFSIRVDPANYAPYLTYCRSDTPTIAWQLRAMGYKAVSLHLATGRNWYRNAAYPHLGFQRSVFLDPGTNTLLDSDGTWTGQQLPEAERFARDDTCYELILQMFRETEEPVFAFNVTIQNHGGYGDDPEQAEVLYLSLLRSSDEQLGALLETLAAFEEPTVVVFFGDHWSYYDEAMVQAAYGSLDALTAEQMAAYRSTPYVVWSNCGYDFSALPDQTTTCYLGAQTLQQLGLKATPWQNFLLNGAKQYPLYSAYLVQGEEDPAALEAYSHAYACLQYNALTDRKHYASEVFGFLSAP